MEPHTILLVDDHPLFREGLSSLLNARPDFRVVGEAGSGPEALEQVRLLRPDMVLMDLNMPGMDGLEATVAIKRELPETKVVMLTMLGDDEKLFAAIKCGAEGYILKSTTSKEMIMQVRSALRGELALMPCLAAKIIREFAQGEHDLVSSTVSRHVSATVRDGLTLREIEVLRLAAKGVCNKEIANQLSISEHTVKAHMRHILEKLHVRTRAEASAYALSKGLLRSPT